MSDRDPRDPDAVSLSWHDVDSLTDREPPRLFRPVVVAAFEGWNDAGDAASTALEHLELSWDAKPLAAMDPDDYYDFQVTRPTVHLVDGITRRIEWPTTRLSVCRPPGADHDVVLLRGIEPNMRWRGFCVELLTYLEKVGVTTVITLGALLTDTPHTRPVQVSGNAYDAESAARFGLENSRYQGNTGIVGVFQDACVRSGIPAISFWAAVPHYIIPQAPDPKAAVALLHRVEEVLDIEVPLGGLPEQAEAWERTVSEMADADDEVREYVRALEERTESESELPEMSGESIAADFERYLRRRDGGSGGPGRPGGGRGGPGR
jgi:predicted ATP-grasp superfamily ATP-dependent carboligase